MPRRDEYPSEYPDKYRNDYPDGYSDDYQDGYFIRRANGYPNGYSDEDRGGYANGYSDGRPQGYTDRQASGHADDYPSRRPENYATRPAQKRSGRHANSPRRAMVVVASTIAVVAVVAVGVFARVSTRHNSTPQAAAAKKTLAGSPSASPSVSPTIAPPAGWQLAFNASSFPGDTLNTNEWATCYWWDSTGCTNNPTQEKEWYLASQVKVSDGVLHLVAQREPTMGLSPTGQPKEFACRSGMVTTLPSFNFEYGFVQVVARLPYGTGLWEGMWLAATNHDWPPEIDILEHWASQKDGKTYLHPVGGPRQGGSVNTPANLSEGWHTYTLDWTKNQLVWYLDGRKVFSTTTDVPQQSMYIILNLADTSTAKGACTGSMDVKSVKVWEPAATAAS